MSSINPSYLSPPNFFRIMAQKRDKRSLLSCAPPPHPPPPPSSGGLSPLANAVTMWKLALPLVPLLLPNISGVQQKDTKPKPNKQKHREKFEYYFTLLWLVEILGDDGEKQAPLSSLRVSLALSFSLSLSALWLARCTEGPSKLSPQRGTSKHPWFFLFVLKGSGPY